MDLTDPTLLKVLRKLSGLGRPACRVYGRNDCFLIRPMAVFGHVHLVHVGPVTRLERAASAEEVGDAALSALAAYAEFPDRPPPDDKVDPLLKAAGVKSARGFTLGSAMLSVERAGKRVAIVPYNSESFGAQIRRESSQVLCSAQAKPVGDGTEKGTSRISVTVVDRPSVQADILDVPFCVCHATAGTREDGR